MLAFVTYPWPQDASSLKCIVCNVWDLCHVCNLVSVHVIISLLHCAVWRVLERIDIDTVLVLMYLSKSTDTYNIFTYTFCTIQKFLCLFVYFICIQGRTYQGEASERRVAGTSCAYCTCSHALHCEHRQLCKRSPMEREKHMAKAAWE